MPSRRFPAVACAVAAVVGTLAASARAQPGLVVGIDDDTAKWMPRSGGLVGVYRDLGVDRVRVTIPWKLGRTRPNLLVGRYLHRVAGMIAQGQEVVLAVYGRPDQAPLDETAREQYCGFLAHVLTRLPVRDVVVWNEANSPDYWPQEAGAPAYEALLATCWTRLHGLRRSVNVISSTAVHWDPVGFVRALGDAYRASGRWRPIVDTFGHNPYPDFAAERPWARHDDPATVGQGDLPRLAEAIREAFAGTAQPLPGSGRTSIWYLEDGFQTIVPQVKRLHYSGSETDATALPSVVTSSGAKDAPLDQATQLRDALLLAYCQPDVGAFFNFELIDEDRLGGWQSGLYWRDGARKGSYWIFRDTVRRIHEEDVDCSTVTGAGLAPQRAGPPPAREPFLPPRSTAWTALEGQSSGR